MRILLFALMLAGLVMSSSIPRAFEDRALPLALAYVAMQVRRNLFMLWACGATTPATFAISFASRIWHALRGTVLDC